jgi:hypothetical protein
MQFIYKNMGTQQYHQHSGLPYTLSYIKECMLLLQVSFPTLSLKDSYDGCIKKADSQ